MFFTISQYIRMNLPGIKKVKKIEDDIIKDAINSFQTKKESLIE